MRQGGESAARGTVVPGSQQNAGSAGRRPATFAFGDSCHNICQKTLTELPRYGSAMGGRWKS